MKLKKSLWLPGVGAGEDGGRDILGLWGGMYTLLYLKWIISKYLVCSTGNSVQCYVAVWMGEGLRGTDTCACMAESFRCSLKLSHNVC